MTAVSADLETPTTIGVSLAEITRRLDVGVRLTQRQRQYLACLGRGDLDRCVYCDGKLTDETRTIDHVLPLSQKGTNDLDNLVLACGPCNQAKGNRTPAQWRKGVKKADIDSRMAPQVKPKRVKKQAVESTMDPSPDVWYPMDTDFAAVRLAKRPSLSTSQADALRRGWDREQATARLRPMVDPWLEK